MLLKTNLNYCNNSKKKETILKEVKTSLIKYFESTSLPIEVVNQITCEDFINSNPSYYLYYPYLFNTCFQVKNKKKLNLLSISGFLYYKAIILIDDIFDNKSSKNNFQKFFIANICQEETIKILSSLFPPNSSFWTTWNIRKLEYTKAYKLDKSLKTINNFSEFEALADYKSAFGKIAIDCLYHLSGKKDELLYKSILESHKFFYVGFQIMDDIVDYTEDVENGQFNISKHELINILNSENDTIENYSLEEQKKLIYLKNVAKHLYKKATIYIDKSLESQIKLINKPSQLWISELENLYNTATIHFLNIKGFVNVYHTEKKISTKINKQVPLSKGVKNAINYISKNQTLNGNWNDIFNDAGISDVWTTSFVTYLLSESIPKSLKSKAESYIIKNQSSNSLWGYNRVWVEDADSSSFSLLSLKNYDTITHNSVSNWLKYQNKDGGFTTYNNKDVLFSSLNTSYIQNVDGWLQSHFCVSAVAFLVFIELNVKFETSFEKLKSYLVKELKSDKTTLSYWWENDIYAIYFIFLAATKTNDIEVIQLIEKRIEKIIKQQEKLNFFFQGFLLKTLCLSDRLFNKFSKEAKKTASFISSNQFTDGSWAGGYCLKIPHPSIINHNKKDILWKKGNKGTNIIVKDFNRLFTTSSCLTALKSYESRI